jgi:hypothetical protein
MFTLMINLLHLKEWVVLVRITTFFGTYDYHKLFCETLHHDLNFTYDKNNYVQFFCEKGL